MAKTRGASAKQARPASTRSGRQALREKTNTSRARAPVYENDGNTEGLVKDAGFRRGRKRKITPQVDEVVMTGALGTDSTAGATSQDSETLTEARTRELGSSSGCETVQPEATTRKGRPRGARKIVANQTQQEILAGMKKRMEDTAKAQRSRQAKSAGTPGVDDTVRRAAAANKVEVPAVAPPADAISPSPPRVGRNSLAPARRASTVQPGSAMKIHDTPGIESSILALRYFKRRPRQPSMLQMVQQRTASARPSAVHDSADEGSSDLDLDLDLDGADDEDDFAPDAEGTPLKSNATHGHAAGPVSKSLPAPERATIETTSSGSSRKRASEEASSSLASLQARREKRHKSSSTIAQSSFVTALEKSPAAEGPNIESIPASPSGLLSNVEVSNSSPPSPTASLSSPQQAKSPDADVLVVSSWQQTDKRSSERMLDSQRRIDADLTDGTLAEPLSSSPLPEPPLDLEQDVDLADPRSQPAPEQPKRRSKKAKDMTLSTAELQDLLPRRRRRVEPRQRKAIYDLDSNSEEESASNASAPESSEDELQKEPRTKGRASAATTKKAPPNKRASSRGKSTKAPSKKNALPSPRKRVSRTYGRPTTSDKENDAAYESPPEDTEESILPDTSLTMHEVSKSHELEDAKRKFAEIDDWDMEFESLGAEDHRSSSIGWR